MNDKLPPEVRVKVAGECEPKKKWSLTLGGDVIELTPKGFIERYWNPRTDPFHLVALTRTAARLIEELPTVTPSDSQRKRLYLYQSNTAIATNDTDALEGIVAELLGFL